MERREFLKTSAVAVGALCFGQAGVMTGCANTAYTRTETDMAGREVGVPEQVERVFCTNPIGTVNMYGLNPDLLVGWNFLPAGDNQSYISDKYLELPSLGVWMGSGSVPNAEEIVAQDPDVLLCYWTADDAGTQMAEEVASDTGLPVLVVDYDIRNVGDSYRWVGNLVGQAERAEELAAYCEERLETVSQIVENIPEDERKSVFLAQGQSGLTTDPVGSMHVTDAFELLGLTNVADLPGLEGQGMGMPTVNLEQILEWNPDVVLVSEYSMSDAESSNIYDEIRTDEHWLNIPAVAKGNIYRIPQGPFSWFGRPPSAVRVLGCLWLVKLLYSDYADDIDMRQETIDFYQMFYRYDLEEDRLSELLSSAGIDPQTGEAYI